jgi:hypothetical protein
VNALDVFFVAVSAFALGMVVGHKYLPPRIE